MKGQYHCPMATEGDFLLYMGKSKLGRRFRRDESRPSAWFSCNLYEREIRSSHPFLLKNFGGTESVAVDLAKKLCPW